MINIVYGEAHSGKTYYSSNFNVLNKVILDEAHNIDFKNYVFKKDINYFIVVQDLQLVDLKLKSTCDFYTHCYVEYLDGERIYNVKEMQNDSIASE